MEYQTFKRNIDELLCSDTAIMVPNYRGGIWNLEGVGDRNDLYHLNDDHIVRVYEDTKEDDVIFVYVMDNEEKPINYSWCKKTSLEDIKKIASQMLFELGYNGQIIENKISKGNAEFYFPNGNEVDYPIDISYFKYHPENERYTSGTETICSYDEYEKSMKRHQENDDTIKTFGSISFCDIEENIFRINEYALGAIWELDHLSDILGELCDVLDRGFSKDVIDQLKDSYEMIAYLLGKTIELKGKLPEDLLLKYTDI